MNENSLRVRITYTYDEAIQDLLAAQLDARIVVTYGEDVDASADYHILITGRPTEDQLAASPHLRTLIIPWAGLPERTRQTMRRFPHIAVHNLHHNAAPVAEYAIALLLTAAKEIVPPDRELRRNDWTPRYRPNRVVMLTGKTALVLGYGHIGQRVAALCRGLGMQVVATRRSATDETDDGTAVVYPAAALTTLLPRADAVLVCLPHTEESDGLLGTDELALLPRGAILVNIGRGAVADEAALFAALKNNALHAAGLDVWYNYPDDRESRTDTAPSSYPFYELDNVVMSPHRAGSLWQGEMDKLRMTHLARLLNAAAANRPMPNRVDLDRGY